MLLYVVYAERRGDFASRVVAFSPEPGRAYQLAGSIASDFCTPGGCVLRCVTRRAWLERDDIAGIVWDWGRTDAAVPGLDLDTASVRAAARFPTAYLGAYLDGFQRARQADGDNATGNA